MISPNAFFVSVLFLALALALAIYSPLQVFAELTDDSSSPFSAALSILQNQIKQVITYTFDSISLLRTAMTHRSFSEEDNRGLSILGASVIETSVAFKLLANNVDILPRDLNDKISKVCNLESCSEDGWKLGLLRVVRVSSKTDPSSPQILCGAFRAIFGAVALDSGSCDEASRVFLLGHYGPAGSGSATSR